jgi:hypothetical protein
VGPHVEPAHHVYHGVKPPAGLPAGFVRAPLPGRGDSGAGGRCGKGASETSSVSFAAKLELAMISRSQILPLFLRTYR